MKFNFFLTNFNDDPWNFHLQIGDTNNDERTAEEQFELVHRIRKFLSQPGRSLIDEVLDCGFLPIFISFLGFKYNPKLQAEAAWALTNIASGNSQQTKRVVEAGAIPHLLKLLESSDLEVAEQSVWAMGNIIGDGPELRDVAIKSGAIPSLLSLVKPASDIPLSFLRNISWVLSNLCIHKIRPLQIQTVSEILPAFMKFLHHSDLKILNDSVWGLCFLTDYGFETIQLLIDFGFVPILVSLMGHRDEKIQKGVLRGVRNIVTSTNEHTQKVLDCYALDFIEDLVCSTNEYLRRESTWILSNIAAGNQRQIQMIYDRGLLPKIIENLRFCGIKIQSEAAWAILNITFGGSLNQIKGLIFEGAIEALCSLLGSRDLQAIRVSLEAITNILRRLIVYRPIVIALIEDCNGLREIEDLHVHADAEIHQIVHDIETFFHMGHQRKSSSGCRGI